MGRLTLWSRHTNCKWPGHTMLMLILYWALAGLVRPFAVHTCIIKCIWYMVTFRERPHALSITAVCIGLAQHHPLGLDEKHINVWWLVLVDLLGWDAIIYNCNVLSRIRQQAPAHIIMDIWCQNLSIPNREDGMSSCRGGLIQLLELSIKAQLNGSRVCMILIVVIPILAVNTDHYP